MYYFLTVQVAVCTVCLVLYIYWNVCTCSTKKELIRNEFPSIFSVRKCMHTMYMCACISTTTPVLIITAIKMSFGVPSKACVLCWMVSNVNF